MTARHTNYRERALSLTRVRGVAAGEDIAHNLAEAARAVPSGVISLVSALRHHELTTQLPYAVWMTIPH